MENYTTFVYSDEKIKILPLYIEAAMTEFIDKNSCFETVAEHYAFICCEQGEVWVESDGKCIKLTQESGLLTIKGKKYRYLTENSGCKLKIITYDGSGVPQIIAYFSLTDAETFAVDLPHFELDFDHISFNVRMKYGFRAALIFQQIIYDIFNSGMGKKAGKNMEILNKYIMENYCSSLDIQTLADVYGTSVSYLCREFKAKYNMSPIAYVNNLRVEKARKMLVTSRKKVADIAVACGFINTEYFCYVFKKYEHCTPLQYRNNRSQLSDVRTEERRVRQGTAGVAD